MRNVNTEHASHDPTGSARSDRGTLIKRRALILGILAIPCLLIIVGLGLGLDTLALGVPQLWITGLASLAVLLLLVLFNYYLLKENPRLKDASMGIFRSYRRRVMGLDEREKLVIDQAYRTSYLILAPVCSLLVFCLLISSTFPHLAYRLGFAGWYCIFLGVVSLLSILPATIVAWHERVWVQKEEIRVR